MDTIKSNYFTYGFELEGVFGIDVIDKVEGLGYDVDLKEDGSVRDRDLPYSNMAEYSHECNHDNHDEDESCDDDNTGTATEAGIGIFKDFKSFISVLALFKNEKNYFENDSCGLHVHIKPKKSYEDTRYMAFDKKLIKNVQSYASSSLCEHVRQRVASNSYCKSWGSFSDMLYKYKRREKYSFMGNHHSGTIEFRFFAPCKHKVENVFKFFKFFFAELNRIELETKKGFYLQGAELKDVEITQRMQSSGSIKENVKVNKKSDKKINETIGICA